MHRPLPLLALFLAVFCGCSANAEEAEFHWLVRAGGPGADKARGLAADPEGNSYLTGEFSGRADFGDFTLTSRGESDIFIAKYDTLGRCLWARQAGGSKTDRGYGIAVDVWGNVHVTGHYGSEDAVFGEGEAVPNPGDFSVFFAKYDSEGKLLWVRNGGSEGYDTSQGVTVGLDGRCYFTGGLRGPGRIAGAPLLDEGRGNLFLVSFDADGEVQWLRHSSGTGSAQGRSLAVDETGRLLLAGFGSGGKEIAGMSLPKESTREPFVVAYDPEGGVSWSWHAGGRSDGLATSVALDGAGGAYFVGMFKGTLRFGEESITSRGDSDFYLARLDAGGQPLWFRRGGGPGTDYALDMVAGPDGNVYVGGELSETIEVDTSAAPLSVTSAGARDLYVARFSPDGVLRRFVRSGGERNDLAYGIGVDASAQVYLTGAFDAVTTHGSLSATAKGRNDVFLLKLGLE